MKHSELEVAGMLQDNQDTIYELKEELKRYKLFCTHTCNEDENLRNRVIDRVKKELEIVDNTITWG
tara:strand:+ start:44 stop:241 length:198 start_codon:yes stop_codon:yes gene_type:complete